MERYHSPTRRMGKLIGRSCRSLLCSALPNTRTPNTCSSRGSSYDQHILIPTRGLPINYQKNPETSYDNNSGQILRPLALTE